MEPKLTDKKERLERDPIPSQVAEIQEGARVGVQVPQHS